MKRRLINIIAQAAIIGILLSITSCTKTIAPTGVSITESSSATSQSSVSGDAESLVLDEYSPPDDGLDYDTTPLGLNQPIEFIKRVDNRLYDGKDRFRFISVNAPTALDANPFEQEDIIKTVAQMGGQVVRTYTFSIRTKDQSDTLETYITGKDQYNETAFLRLDNLLALANKYGVRLIIPFIDPYTYNGGIQAFLQLYGITPKNSPNEDNGEFYSNDEVARGFLDFVSYVLNRKNTITGVYYKDDPAIMAWETGNELQGAMPKYNLWIRDLCREIKKSDTNHLIVDGWFGIRPQALVDPDIDIVSHHFYPQFLAKSFAEELNNLATSIAGKKAFMIGEFGFVDLSDIEAFYDAVIASEAVGSMIWSIRNHDGKGGFVQHRENEKFCAYHWPGFDQGREYDEKETLQLTYLKGYEIQNKKPKLIEKPAAPQIIEPIKNPQTQIKWMGSTGAYGYDFQRSEHSDGPWTVIGVNISDDYMFATVMFKDKTADLKPGQKYYYRIRARSDGGFSEWSVPVEAAVPDNN